MLDEDRAGTAVDIASFELIESGGRSNDFRTTESSDSATVVGALGVSDSEVVGTAEKVAGTGEALSDRGRGCHLSDIFIGDDGEVGPGAIGLVGAVGLAGGGSGSLDTAIGLDAAAPDVDGGELGDVRAGRAGDEVT